MKFLDQSKALHIPTKDRVDIVQDLKFGFYLFLFQSFLMFSISTLLVYNHPIALFVYDHVRFLKDYIPILWRFSSLFEELNRSAEFYPVFAIYVLDILIQIVFFSLFVIGLYRKIDLRAGYRRTTTENFLFVFLLLLSLFGTVDLVFGSYNIRTPGFFSNGLIEGNYFSGVFLFCFFIPGSNFVFYCLLYTRYGKIFGPILRSQPFAIENFRREKDY